MLCAGVLAPCSLLQSPQLQALQVGITGHRQEPGSTPGGLDEATSADDSRSGQNHPAARPDAPEVTLRLSDSFRVTLSKVCNA